MVNVGVIGSGGMGGRHIHNLAGQTPAQVVAIMDLDRARAEAVAAQTGGGQVYTDTTALITDPKVEAVVVASPDPFHAEAVLACIEAGKPVLCEKPLATNLPDAKNVLEAEMAAGKRLVQLAFMREYDPAHQAVKASAENGALGQLLMFHGIHSGYGVGYPRTTDDVIINSAVHDIHSARWLLNQEIAQVYVQRVVADAARPETCRLLLVQLTFQDGSLGFIEVNADSSYGYQVDVELTGSDGSIRTARAAAPCSGCRRMEVKNEAAVRVAAARSSRETSISPGVASARVRCSGWRWVSSTPAFWARNLRASMKVMPW